MSATRTSEPVRALLGEASVEMGCAEAGHLAEAARLLPAGSDIFIAMLPGESWQELVAAAGAVRDAGLNPVPHLPGRRIRDRAELAGIAGELARAGVTRVLLIAGDVPVPAGDYASTVPILETGELPRAGIRSICVAGHPEGHAHMTADEQHGFEARKAQLAAQQGFELSFATQLCFESAPIIAWERQLRAHGINAPVRAGLPGSASLDTLRQFAQIYGAGPSARVLAADEGVVLADQGPRQLVAQLAEAQVSGGSCFHSVHLFSFGSFLSSCRWLATERRADR